MADDIRDDAMTRELRGRIGRAETYLAETDRFGNSPTFAAARAAAAWDLDHDRQALNGLLSPERDA